MYGFINFLPCSIKMCLSYHYALFLQYFSFFLHLSALRFKVQDLECIDSGFKSDLADDFC